MSDNALSWLEKRLVEDGVLLPKARDGCSVKPAQFRAIEQVGVLKPFAPPFNDYRRETEYQWHTCRIRRATVTWIA